MSIKLLKRTVSDLKKGDSDDELPRKRIDPQEVYQKLMENDIDRRVLRKAKIVKKTRKNHEKTENLMDKVEKKSSKIKSKLNIEEKIDLLKKRALPSKYVELLTKS
jgi:hypothetical protein